jgi:magnesium-transporting ATPase (P-type)
VKQRAVTMPSFKILNFVPFNAARRKTEAKVQLLPSTETLLVQKGAVNRLLDFCHVCFSVFVVVGVDGIRRRSSREYGV